jgi:hypothetical protein
LAEQTRDIKRRIRSIQNTEQITKAMQMVAAARLRRAEERVASARPYSEKIDELIKRVAENFGELSHPFFLPRERRNVGYVVFTSDRGLCGGYNSHIIRRAELAMAQDEQAGIIIVGAKGRDYFRRREYNLLAEFLALGDKPSVAQAEGIAKTLVELYKGNIVDEVNLVYTEYISTANGENDRCRELLSEAGVQPIFFGYQVKPGGHTCAGSKNGKPVIMLSGNPMACFVGYCLLAKPALCALQGLSPKMKRFPALATSPFLKKGGPRRFLLGYALCSPGGWRVAVLPAQKSSMRRSLADCNCLIDLPAGHPPVQPEDPVDIIPLGE